MNRRVLQGAAVIPALAVAYFVWQAFGALGVAAFVLLLVVGLGAWEIFGTKSDQGPKVEIRRSFWIGLLLPLGLLLLFVAERVIGDADPSIGWWRTIALLCLATALAWRVLQFTRASGAAKKVETRLMIAIGGVAVALVLYALSTDWGIELMGLRDEAAERTSGSFGVLWIALMLVSVSALLFMELTYRVMPVEEAVELRRVDAAAATGLTLGLAFVFVASINYVADQRDVVRDLSYFKTTRPSEASLAMVRRLNEPVEAVLFYPRANEVLDQLRPYFDELARANRRFEVRVLDHALAPGIAQQHRIRGNGFVALLRGEGEGQTAETFEVGVELDQARSRLRTLDGRFQQHFAQLTTRPRELFLTGGHRERAANGADGDPPEQRLGELNSALQRSNITSRELGIAQGLANRVPEGAPAVAVIGPREPFIAEEAQSLLRYVRSGGRVVVFLDPDVDHGLNPFLNGLGLEIARGVLHSERDHMVRTNSEADRQIVYSNQYSAHPTVTLANRYRRYVGSVFDRGGAIVRREGNVEGVEVTFPLRTGDGFWLDLDDDHEKDDGEPAEGRYNMMAAVTIANRGGQEGRVVVIGDGDFITDAYIGNRGNAFVLMDLLNWLVGEESVFGPTQTEEDVPIQHTTEQDKAWFYATSFGAPLPLLLLGLWMARRRYGGGAKAEKSPRKPGDPPRSAAAASGTTTSAAPSGTREEASDEDADDSPDDDDDGARDDASTADEESARRTP